MHVRPLPSIRVVSVIFGYLQRLYCVGERSREYEGHGIVVPLTAPHISIGVEHLSCWKTTLPNIP
jgi:hypothetical protein